MTKVGRYQVTFSIPVESRVASFVAYTVENIMDLGHAQMIERALLDGGCPSVYVSVRTADKEQPFVGTYPNNLPKNYVGWKVQEALARKG